MQPDLGRSLDRALRYLLLAVAMLTPPLVLGGCGGKEKEGGTLAPPVQDDYGKVMEEFMKKNPPPKN